MTITSFSSVPQPPSGGAAAAPAAARVSNPPDLVQDNHDRLTLLVLNYDAEGITDLFNQGPSSTVMEALAKGDSPLHLAAKMPLNAPALADGDGSVKAGSQAPDVLGALIRHLPADALNARNADGHTPLMLAAKEGQHLNVEALLKAGASLTDADDRGWTALFFAAFSGAVDVIKTILTLGLLSRHTAEATGPEKFLDQRDHFGQNAFMIAVESGNLAAAHSLLDAGANINAQNKEGKTALMLAALSDGARKSTFDWLIEAGADRHIKDAAGLTALDYINSDLHPPMDATLM